MLLFAPSAVAQRTPQPWPAWWLPGALCVHRGEQNTNPSAGPTGWRSLTGNGYGGGMQFTLPTWNRVPGVHARSLADIARASRREQLRRAYFVWRQDGGSWREWPTTSRLCGLR